MTDGGRTELAQCEAPRPFGLCLVGEPTDWVTSGRSVSFGAPDISLRTLRFNGEEIGGGVDIRLEAPEDWNRFWLQFYPSTTERLRAGAYEGAERWPFNPPGTPGLDVSASSRGCNESDGRFEILAFERDSDGGIARLVVNFEQRCEPLGRGAWLRGQFRYGRGMDNPHDSGQVDLDAGGQVSDAGVDTGVDAGVDADLDGGLGADP